MKKTNFPELRFDQMVKITITLIKAGNEFGYIIDSLRAFQLGCNRITPIEERFVIPLNEPIQAALVDIADVMILEGKSQEEIFQLMKPYTSALSGYSERN